MNYSYLKELNSMRMLL